MSTTSVVDSSGPATGERLWSVKEAARFLGVPHKTLYQWRYQETGPPSHRLGRHLRYDPDEVRAWVLNQP